MATLKSMLKLKTQLQVLLEQNELSASQLSRASGVPKQTISYWLSGGVPRKLDHLRKVAVALDTTIDTLCFGGNDQATKRPNDFTTYVDSVHDEWISGLFEIKIRRVKQ